MWRQNATILHLLLGFLLLFHHFHSVNPSYGAFVTRSIKYLFALLVTIFFAHGRFDLLALFCQRHFILHTFFQLRCWAPTIVPFINDIRPF